MSDPHRRLRGAGEGRREGGEGAGGREGKEERVLGGGLGRVVWGVVGVGGGRGRSEERFDDRRKTLRHVTNANTTLQCP